jgi:type IV pilus assembly protein PilV
MIMHLVTGVHVPVTLPSRIQNAGRSKVEMVRAGGFTLLESMVSFVILGVGLLGIAALQGNALRYSNQAYQRGQAVIVAYDIFERMRANPAGAAAGYYVSERIEDGSSPPPSPDDRPEKAFDCTLRSCNPQQLAKYDMEKWNQSISQLLPSGSATLIANGKNEYEVTISWMEQGDTPSVGDNIAAVGDHTLTISATM